MDAIMNISKSIRVKDKRFSYAGIKDKRGVTAQRVTVSHLSAERMSLVNASKGPLKNIAVGDYCYVKHPLLPGQLEGNRFSVSASSRCCCAGLSPSIVRFSDHDAGCSNG